MFEDLTARLGAASLAVALMHAAAPSPAHACSGFACNVGSFYLEPGSQLPSNTRALLWFPPRDAGDTPAVEPVLHLTRIDGAVAEEVLIMVMSPRQFGEREVQLPKGLTAGARYRLWVEGDSACLPDPIEVVAGEEAPYPEQLGTIVLSEPTRGDVMVATASGSCDTPLPAVMVDVDVELAADAKPWAALLQYTTRVDAKPWRPQWSLGDSPYEFTGAQTKVYAECPGAPANGLALDPAASHDGASEGTHQLRIEASLPGIITLLYTDPVELELQCDPKPAAEPDAGTPGTVQAGKGVPADDEAQAGRDGALPPPADAGATAPGERTSVQTRTENDASDGCAISPTHGHSGRPPAWAWLPAALALLQLRSRLRRRSARLLTGR